MSTIEIPADERFVMQIIQDRDKTHYRVLLVFDKQPTHEAAVKQADKLAGLFRELFGWDVWRTQ